MTKPLTTGKKTVELQSPPRPSRIRRDPVPVERAPGLIGMLRWDTPEWEVRLAIGGITFFGLAIAAAIIDIGHVLSF